MTLSFFLDKRGDEKSLSYIYLYVSRGGKERKKISTGIKLLPKQWNEDKQRVRATCDEHLLYNNRLSEIETGVRELLVFGKDSTWQTIVDRSTEIARGKKSGKLFDALMEFIEFKRQSCSHGQIKKYMVTYNRFKRDYPHLSFEDMDIKWSDRFVQQLIDAGHLNSSIAKQITVIKTFMRWSMKRGYHNNDLWTTEKIGPSRPEKLDVIALLPNEVEQLRTCELGDYHSRLRWTFLFSCYTGARFSDVMSFKKTDVRDGKWRFEVKKLRKQSRHVTIPFVGWPMGAIECLEKLDYFIQPISVQYMDRELKKILQIAGINRTVSLTRFSGSTEVVKRGPIHQYITFHCGRRTFISVLLNKGIAASAVMKLTGITNYKTLQKYLETYTEDIERALLG